MKTTVHFEQDDDIIEICKDSVFKAVFTKDMPQSRIALSKLVSALIGREVVIEEILANEPPADSLHDRQVRFDINCRAENGERANVEMCYNPQPFEPVRLEFHAAKIFSAQNIQGKDKNYGDLLRVYQIAILDKKRFFPDGLFYHAFEYYDPAGGVSLGGKTRIITLELTKLENAEEKMPQEMSARERWAFYFRNLTNKKRRAIINEIVKLEEGIAMASEVIMTISRDEEERARIMRDEKILLDYYSGLNYAERKGIQKGEKRGMKKGEKKGRQEERQYFLSLIDQGLSAEEIRQRLS